MSAVRAPSNAVEIHSAAQRIPPPEEAWGPTKDGEGDADGGHGPHPCATAEEDPSGSRGDVPVPRTWIELLIRHGVEGMRWTAEVGRGVARCCAQAGVDGGHSV